MKPTLSWLVATSLLTLTPSPSHARGGVISDGGGHPLLVVAKPYPDLAKLDAAFHFAHSAMVRSNLPAELQKSIVGEYDSLRMDEKLKWLPELIILTPGAGPEGYKPPSAGNPTHFISLGGMTANEKGSYTFFSQRTLGYSTAELGDLVLHEVLHHVLPIGAAEDEDFVDALTKSILSLSVDRRQLAAARTGVVVRDGFISGRGVARWVAADFREELEHFYEGHPENFRRAYETLENQLINALPESLTGLTAGQLINQKLTPAVWAGVSQAGLSLAQLQAWGRSHRRIFRLSLELDPDNALANDRRFDSGYCKKEITTLAWILGARCGEEDLLQVAELLR